MSQLTIGTVYRYSSSNPVDVEIIDALPNLLFHTNTPGQNKALLEAGINPIRTAKKSGSSETKRGLRRILGVGGHGVSQEPIAKSPAWCGALSA